MLSNTSRTCADYFRNQPKTPAVTQRLRRAQSGPLARRKRRTTGSFGISFSPRSSGPDRRRPPPPRERKVPCRSYSPPHSKTAGPVTANRWIRSSKLETYTHSILPTPAFDNSVQGPYPPANARTPRSRIRPPRS